MCLFFDQIYLEGHTKNGTTSGREKETGRGRGRERAREGGREGGRDTDEQTVRTRGRDTRHKRGGEKKINPP